VPIAKGTVIGVHTQEVLACGAGRNIRDGWAGEEADCACVWGGGGFVLHTTQTHTHTQYARYLYRISPARDLELLHFLRDLVRPHPHRSVFGQGVAGCSAANYLDNSLAAEDHASAERHVGL
jgi:hypothetical protein